MEYTPLVLLTVLGQKMEGIKKQEKKVNISKLRYKIGSSHFFTHKKGIDAKVIKIGVMHKILALKKGKSK